MTKKIILKQTKYIKNRIKNEQSKILIYVLKKSEYSRIEDYLINLYIVNCNASKGLHHCQISNYIFLLKIYRNLYIDEDC